MIGKCDRQFDYLFRANEETKVVYAKNLQQEEIEKN